MHHETLLYMFQELDHGLKRRPAGLAGAARPGSASARASGRGAGRRGRSRRPAGVDPLRLGQRVPRGAGASVPAFAVDDRPVTNADLLEFVAGRRLRRAAPVAEADWDWRTRRGVERPHSWRPDDGGFRVRSLLEDVPFETAAAWPAMASWAEAAAYARWRGARLLTEAEWHRAALGAARTETCANVHFRHGSPLPVGAHPSGASAWGVLELVGNGWEWTATPFAPFPGFEPMACYPGLLRRLLRRRPLRPPGRLVGDRRGAPPAELPQLVPAPLPVRLLEVPLRALPLTPKTASDGRPGLPTAHAPRPAAGRFFLKGRRSFTRLA